MILPVKVIVTSIVCCIVGYSYADKEDKNSSKYKIGAWVCEISGWAFLAGILWLIWR